jgi:hypothetical protein
MSTAELLEGLLYCLLWAPIPPRIEFIITFSITISSTQGTREIGKPVERYILFFRVSLIYLKETYAGCFKKGFATLKAYINLFRGHYSVLNCHNVANTEILSGIVMFECNFHWYCKMFKK